MMQGVNKPYSGEPKDFLRMFKAVQVAVGAKRLFLNPRDTKSVSCLNGITNMAYIAPEFIPSKDGDWTDFDMADAIAQSEAKYGPIPEREKEAMLAIERLVGSNFDQWSSCHAQVLKITSKHISEDIPEWTHIDVNDPFGAPRLLAMLRQNYIRYLKRNAATLNNKILLHLKEFSKAIRSTDSLNKFFSDLHELLNTAQIAKISTHPEDFMVKELAAQLKDRNNDLKLQMLGIKATDQDLKLSDFEDEIKKIDLEELEVAQSKLGSKVSSSDDPESIEVQKDVALSARTGNLRDRFRKGQEHIRFAEKTLPAQKDNRKENRHGNVAPHVGSMVRRVDPDVWKNMSQKKRDKYLKLKRKIRKLVSTKESSSSDSSTDDDQDMKKGEDHFAGHTYDFSGLRFGDAC